MNIWNVADVMAFTGLSRKATIRLLQTTDAPVLPRQKNQKFLIPKEPFIEWWQGGKYEEV